ncbi:MAG: phage integrase SAM-like domain-containing protein, partial [Microcystis panniformis]
MDDSQKYEADCQRIRKVNHELLKDFESWLESSGLSEKTINNHISNIDFYINEYLLYEGAVEAKDGVDMVGDFLGYWFIK